MRLFEEADVRAIFHACHPMLPRAPAKWYEAHPTLVIEAEREIVGYTSYSMVMQPDVSLEGEVMIGYGIDIKPGHQGKGYGKRLHAHRMDIARQLGAKVFVGHAKPDNHAMLRLFEIDGLKPVGQAPSSEGGTMLLFMGPVA